MPPFTFTSTAQQKYSRLRTEEDSLPNSEAQDAPAKFLKATPRLVFFSKANTFAVAQAILNLVWTFLLMVTTVTVLLQHNHNLSPEWHETDIEAARPFIKRTPVKFTAGIYWNETMPETTFRVWDKTEPLYVGARSPELDAAWDEISLPLDLYITESEARGIPEIPQGMYKDPKTGNYTVIVEAIHSLHCLNMLRKRIYIREYPEIDTPPLANHVDHCIEALRMNLMCSGDMTPVPLFYSPAIDKVQPNFEVTHSCRNFKSLIKWARGRSVHWNYEN